MPDPGWPVSLKSTAKQSDRGPAAERPGPPTVRWVIEEITGPEGREVAAAQANAIEELLRWWIEQHKTSEAHRP